VLDQTQNALIESDMLVRRREWVVGFDFDFENRCFDFGIDHFHSFGVELWWFGVVLECWMRVEVETAEFCPCNTLLRFYYRHSILLH